MHSRIPHLLASLALALLDGAGWAQEPPEPATSAAEAGESASRATEALVEARTVQAAEMLLDATVTVRILPPQVRGAGEADGDERTGRSRRTALDDAALEGEEDGVTVCSGTSLGDGRIVTFGLRTAAGTATGLEYRVTLPGGEQAAAQPRVVDHYSGLVLLEIEKRDLAGFKLAGQLPTIGGTVLTASASGIDKPLVSKGILSGVDRTVPFASLPPMLQCDVRTTDASSGAPVIDGDMRLIGIVAATQAARQQFGWSYAVPVRHVERIMKARSDDRLVILVRRRPILGLRLGQADAPGAVQVERVTEDGPSDRAGIKPGEILYEAEGRKIRSVYQAVALTLRRLPGEKMNLVVGDEDARRTVEVELGGGSTIASRADLAPQQGGYAVNQTNLRTAGPNRIQIQKPSGIAELSVEAPDGRRSATPTEVELLQRQVEAYESAILRLREQQLQSLARERESQEVIDTLKKQVEGLQKQIKAAR